MYKTSKKDFQEFRKEAIYWLKYFGMSDWQIHFEHEEMDECRAAAYYDLSGKCATITLNTIWTNSHRPKNMKRLAFHEVLEVMLGDLSFHAESIYNHGIVQGLVHVIIRRLENSVFEEKRR